MRGVLISIKPNRCELIASGKQTVYVLKKRPKMETPFKCYIYCTAKGRPLVWGSPVPGYVEEGLVQTLGYSKTKADEIFGVYNGKVIGEFVCDNICAITRSNLVVKEDAEKALAGSCVSNKEAREYIGKSEVMYGWHISDIKIYDEPKKLGDFIASCVYREDEHECVLPRHVACSGQDMDMNLDGSINIYTCKYPRHIERPPQSWCYVEELDGCK